MPPPFAGPACPAGAAQEEHLLLLLTRKATAAGLLLEYMYMLVCICIHLVTERAPTRRLPLPHCLWRAGRGGEGKEGHALPGWRLGWKDCCCGWLLLDLLAISRMLCSASVLGVCCRLCLTLTGKKKKKTDMERSGSTPSALRRASLPGGSGTGGAPTAAAERHSCWTAAGTYVRAGLYWFVLYAFRHRLRAWPGVGIGGRSAGRGVSSLLSMPLATGLGPGPERAGSTAGQRYFFPLLSPPTLGLALRRSGRARSWMRNFAILL